MRPALLRLLVLCVALPPSALRAEPPPLKVMTVAAGLERPWGLAFLPDGSMLVTERPGRMRIVAKDGTLGEPLTGLPAVDARAQGGLLDVALDPAFDANRLVYWSYAEATADAVHDNDGMAVRGTLNGTTVARGKLNGSRIDDVQVIFRQQPKVAAVAHFGGRLVFGRDGRLFVTLGERLLRRDDAQKLDNHLGKVVRIERDGKAPADNPFVKTNGAMPEIWSIGHRNVQGATLHPGNGALWTHEHGPEGGDEVNIDEAGRNYGWPLVSFGVDYGSGRKIGDGGPTRRGIETPLTTWVPSIAPSGMTFLTSDRYPGWKGNLFVGALRGQALVRMVFEGRKVVREERLLTGEFGRIRDVRQGPDGWLYLLTDMHDGRILRVER